MSGINKRKTTEVVDKKITKKVKQQKQPIVLPSVSTIEELIKLAELDIEEHPNVNMTSLRRIYPHLVDLNNMVGMDSVKQSIFNQIIYYIQDLHRRDFEGEYLHTQIIGPPGTGKTTIATIIGRIYRDLGILGDQGGRVRVIHRDDLVAGFVGQTAIKTKKILVQSLGGVLFLDEAYSMGNSDKEDGSDSFAKEAIDTITSFLSEHKQDFCFIVAGYEEEIKKYFFALNRGLERRFPWKHHIKPYSADELCLITQKMIQDTHWEIDATPDEIKTIIKNNMDLFKNSGGDVENFISKTKISHSKRVFTLDMDIKFRLTRQDFENGIVLVRENAHDHATEAFKKEKMLSMYT